MISILDYDSSPGSTCWNVGCTLLPVGYLLLLVDAYFDLRWVLFPSTKTKQALIDYYTTILTPTNFYPGYWYPVYVIYKLCLQCPTSYHFLTLGMFLPVAYRYVGILRRTDTRLDHWWTIIVWRVMLAIVTTWNIQSLGCRGPREYMVHLQETFCWNATSL